MAQAHIVVIGRTQEGKTFFVIYTLLPQLRYYVIFDTKHSDFNDSHGVIVDNIVDLIMAVNRREKVVYRCKYRGFANLSHEFNMVARALLLTNNYYLVCDEISDVCGANYIGDDHEAFLRTGLSRGLISIAATQRPQLMSKTIFTQSQVKFYFRVDDYDIKALRGYCPFVERIRDLKKWEYIATDGANYKIEKSEKR